MTRYANSTDHGAQHSVRRKKGRTAAWIFPGVLALALVLMCNAHIFAQGVDQQNAYAPWETGGVKAAFDPASIAAPPDAADWNLILVNKWNPIPDAYEVELTQLSNGKSVDSRIYPALQEMFDTARAEGVYPIVASGYRTAKRQQQLMDEKIAAFKAEGSSSASAKQAAEKWVAVPGTSEHQLGIAVDINADGVRSAGEEVYAWLDENAHRFGFVRRYPPDKTQITGVNNEPWHYRYVGIAAAAQMYQQDLCLEEYLDSVA